MTPQEEAVNNTCAKLIYDMLEKEHWGAKQ